MSLPRNKRNKRRTKLKTRPNKQKLMATRTGQNIPKPRVRKRKKK